MRLSDATLRKSGDAILHREVNPELIKSKAADSAGEVEGVVAVHHTAVDVLTTGVRRTWFYSLFHEKPPSPAEPFS